MLLKKISNFGFDLLWSLDLDSGSTESIIQNLIAILTHIQTYSVSIRFPYFLVEIRNPKNRKITLKLRNMELIMANWTVSYKLFVSLKFTSLRENTIFLYFNSISYLVFYYIFIRFSFSEQLLFFWVNKHLLQLRTCRLSNNVDFKFTILIGNVLFIK